MQIKILNGLDDLAILAIAKSDAKFSTKNGIAKMCHWVWHKGGGEGFAFLNAKILAFALDLAHGWTCSK